MQNTSIDYFWERRKDTCVRTKLSYDFSLIDCREEELQEVIKFDGGSQPFTIERLLKGSKQIRPKLTLLTKLKKSQSPEKLKQNKTIELFDDVSYFMISMKDLQNIWSPSRKKLQ